MTTAVAVSAVVKLFDEWLFAVVPVNGHGKLNAWIF
jgi:hypothetical protein